jgi:hypothetical protein
MGWEGMTEAYCTGNRDGRADYHARSRDAFWFPAPKWWSTSLGVWEA